MMLSKKKISLLVLILVSSITVLVLSYAYLRSTAAKKTFIRMLSEKATVLLGQEVVVEDLSFGFSEGISLHEIHIRNPDDFPKGDLLYIKRLFLGIEFEDLLKRRFDFREVVVHKPALSLIKDQTGRMNISGEMREFFTRKSSLRYRIDTLKIEEGTVDFNQDERFHGREILVAMQHIASDAETKTLLQGGFLYGEGRVKFRGWTKVKSEPKELSLTIEPEGLSRSPLARYGEKYGMHADINSADLSLKFSPGKDIQVVFHASAAVMKEGRYALEGPATIRCSGSGGIDLEKGLSSVSADVAFSADNIRFPGIDPIMLAGSGKFEGKKFTVEVPKARIPGGVVRVNVSGETTGGLFPVSVSLSAANMNVEKLSRTAGVFTKIPYDLSGQVKKLTLDVMMHSADDIRGKAFFQAEKLMASSAGSQRKILNDGRLTGKMTFKGRDISLVSEAGAGKVRVGASAEVQGFLRNDRKVHSRLNLQQVEMNDIRNAFWDIFPDSLLYAGLSGLVASDIGIEYHEGRLRAKGKVSLENIILEGENSEYLLGPVNGTVPIAYSRPRTKAALNLPSYERSQFERLKDSFSAQTMPESGYDQITIGSVMYGFRMLEDIHLWVKDHEGVLNIPRLSGNIFGGRLNGAAILDLSDEIRYQAGFLLKGLSLTSVCDEIPPIKGYISGMVDGIAHIKGSGKGLSHLIGKADFWSYRTDSEQTKISKEFLKKIGGPSLKAYLGDRDFDKGIMTLYLQKGFIIFDAFELSNRNFFGMQDLAVKVAPFNNRISIDHLMWSITQAAQRAEKQ
jgi:hypothetical protein